jgi:hypothetical protein
VKTAIVAMCRNLFLIFGMATQEEEINAEDATPTPTLSITEKAISEVPTGNDAAVPVAESEVKIEDFTPRGGDDDMLEGTEIKTSNNFDDNWSDSSSEVPKMDYIFDLLSSISV